MEQPTFETSQQTQESHSETQPAIVVVQGGMTDYTPLVISGFLGPLAVGVLLFVLRRFTKTRRPKL